MVSTTIFISTTFKTSILEISDAISQIQKIHAVEGLNGLFDTTTVQQYTLAISGLNQQEAITLLQKQGLSKAQQEQILTSAGLLSASQSLNASLVEEAVLTSQISGAKAEAVLSELGLIDAKTGNLIATNECTVAEVAQALATQGIVGADAEAILSQLGLTTANKATAVSFTGLTTAIKANIAAIGTWLTTNPVGWCVLTVGAIYGLTKAYDALTISEEEIAEAHEKSVEKAKQSISEYEELEQELETIQGIYDDNKKKLEDLYKLRENQTITQAEEDYLEELEAQNEKLRKQIEYKQSLADIEAKEAEDDAVKTLNEKTQDGDYTGSKAGKAQYEKITDAEKIERNTGTIKALTDDLIVYEKVIQDISLSQEEIDKYTQQLTAYQKELDSIKGSSEGEESQKQFYKDKIAEIQGLLDGNISYEQYEKATTSVKESIQSLVAENDELLQKVEPLNDAIVSTTGKNYDLKKSNDEIITNAKDAAIGFNDYTDSLNGAADALDTVSENQNGASISFDSESFLESVSAIQSGYETLLSAQEEYNEYGAITASTLKTLMDNNLIQYLQYTADGLSINTSALETNEQALKAQATAELYSAMCNDIQNLSLGDTASLSSIAQSAIANLDSAATTAGENASIAAQGWWEYGASIQSIPGVSGLTGDDYKKAQAIVNQYKNLANSINSLSIGSTNSSKKKSGGGSKSSGSSSSKDAWKEEFQAQYDLLKHNLEMEYITEEQYYSALNALNEKYFANNAKYTDEYRKYQEEVYKGMQKVYKEYIENNMSYLEKALDANKISFGHYSNAVKKMLDDMWHEGKISASDYWSYVEKMLEKQLDIYDSVINAATTLLQEELDKIQEEIDALEDKNDALNDQLEIYDSALSAIEKVYDDEIQKLEDQKQAIQDVIDAMQEENDERERAMALQQAQYNLNRALSQNANYIYKDGQFVYTTDQTAIREAQDSLHEAQYNIDIAELQKQQDALDDYIDVLNSFKSMWQEIAEAYQTAQDSMNAAAILGQNYAQIVLSNNISDIENFKNQYVEIQSQINSNDELIASFEEKIEYYQALKDQWSSIASAYEDAQNRIHAAEVLGANWEQDVLNGRIDVLNNFKNKYIEIQKAIADAAEASAKAQIEAAQNAQAAQTTPSTPTTTSPSSSSGGGGDSSSTATTPTAPTWYVYKNGTKTQLYSGTKAQCKKYIETNNYSIVREEATNHKIYVTPKGNTGGRSGGGNRNMAYASGTTNAKKGLNLVGEEGTETYIDNDGNVSLVTAPSLINMEGGETVKNAKETEELLNPNNFVPIETMELPGLNGTILKLSSDEFRERITKAMPSYSSMVQSAIQTPRYDAIPVNRNNNATITQQVTFNCPNLTDKSGIEYVERELRSLATKAMQFDWSK